MSFDGANLTATNFNGTLNNYSIATEATAGTLVARDGNGYIKCSYINSNRGDETSVAASYIYDTGDG